MKKTIYTLAAITLMAATVLLGCNTSTKKEEDDVADARENTEDAKEELMVAKKEANAEEWKKIKKETNTRITENKIRIAQLKVKMIKSGKSIDTLYAKKIEELEQKNKDIKIKVDSYKNDTSDDWELFKREYNHDMDQLNRAIEDMTVNNKK
jgi:predicted HicB family RNase H-like nuclease